MIGEGIIYLKYWDDDGTSYNKSYGGANVSDNSRDYTFVRNQSSSPLTVTIKTKGTYIVYTSQNLQPEVMELDVDDKLTLATSTNGFHMFVINRIR